MDAARVGFKEKHGCGVGDLNYSILFDYFPSFPE